MSKIERTTEGRLPLPATGQGTDTAMVRWTVGSNKMTIHQSDSRVELSELQFKALMENSQDIYHDMKGGNGDA